MTDFFEHHKESVRRCFNKAVSTYDAHCNTQKLIGNTLLNRFLCYTSRVENIIDLGCGTGLITEQLALKFRYKNFYAIDIADKLLLKAKERLTPYGIKTHEGDFNNFSYKDILFDLAFSNMALHWGLRFDQILFTIHQNLVPRGFIAISLPLVGTFSELVFCAKNHFLSISDISHLLSKVGFEEIEYFSESLVVNFDSVVTALKTIKAVGANYTLEKLHKSLRGKSFLTEHVNLLQRSDGMFSLTYRIGYFIARKK